MKQSFIERYYMQKEVEIDIGGEENYRGIAAECNDGILSLKWDIGKEGYTHIDIDSIRAIWLQPE
ncbi:MAG: hypothetical protein PWP14_1664 [Methanolobus sp.]|uniref:Uncharacterized protein n=1 Tax=Methanolobus chelungpuianus TaxID=502115 RepID=A0AAE3H9U0_9EURY|nr:MM0924 family protein [Methanolobus chelungpuianus]MCQ6962274.1 hypothetical protein [Methanolobus chelungpuianus]MDK2833203.1 hypothetical protein [Methanolobus sp.]MDN5310270.1 hypothetical protein [Methanolobus sp.]